MVNTYLVIKYGENTHSYPCVSSHTGTPYLKVSTGYIDLTSDLTTTGLRIKSRGVVYMPAQTKSTTESYTSTSTMYSGEQLKFSYETKTGHRTTTTYGSAITAVESPFNWVDGSSVVYGASTAMIRDTRMSTTTMLQTVYSTSFTSNKMISDMTNSYIIDPNLNDENGYIQGNGIFYKLTSRLSCSTYTWIAYTGTRQSRTLRVGRTTSYDIGSFESVTTTYIAPLTRSLYTNQLEGVSTYTSYTSTQSMYTGGAPVSASTYYKNSYTTYGPWPAVVGVLHITDTSYTCNPMYKMSLVTSFSAGTNSSLVYTRVTSELTTLSYTTYSVTNSLITSGTFTRSAVTY